MLGSTHLARRSRRMHASSAYVEREPPTGVRWFQRRRAPLISSRERRMLVRWLRRTANHRFDHHPITGRREMLLEDRVAAVRGDLLEIAALLEQTCNPRPASVAALRDLLANAHDSPIYNESLHPSELRASLYYIRLTLPHEIDMFESAHSLRLTPRVVLTAFACVAAVASLLVALAPGALARASHGSAAKNAVAARDAEMASCNDRMAVAVRLSIRRGRPSTGSRSSAPADRIRRSDRLRRCRAAV